MCGACLSAALLAGLPAYRPSWQAYPPACEARVCKLAFAGVRKASASRRGLTEPR